MRDVIVLYGGETSSEREISLRSGKMVADSLSKVMPVELVILNQDILPKEVAHRHDAIIFPVTLGEFGEDGGLQALIENANLCYVGSDSKSSRLCMNKILTKKTVAKFGVPVVEGIEFSIKNGHSINLNQSFLMQGGLVLKPNSRGSSIGVKKLNYKTFYDFLPKMFDGDFLIEKNIAGKDLTVGVLDGKALEIVEILPKVGFLDYNNKYTPGASDRICPANISSEATKLIKHYAEVVYNVCKCRDWARVDFMFGDKEEIFFLEINTIPGMTATSFYPLSAEAAGISYDDLLLILVQLAEKRFLYQN